MAATGRSQAKYLETLIPEVEGLSNDIRNFFRVDREREDLYVIAARHGEYTHTVDRVVNPRCAPDNGIAVFRFRMSRRDSNEATNIHE